MPLNKQKPLPPDHSGNGVLVHSIFKTIQGEGPYAGRFATFVRLFGCNLQCPWCDTDYTSHSQHYAVEEIVHEVGGGDLVVITGGEPFRQNITPLVNALLDRAFLVQIETNGTLYPGDDFPWDRVTVVCSPKTGKIHPKTASRVTAYKYVLSHDGVGTGGLPRTALGHPLGTHKHVARPPSRWVGNVYLQPMDAKDPEENRKNMEAVVKVVMDNPYSNFIMGVQMHKIVGLP